VPGAARAQPFQQSGRVAIARGELSRGGQLHLRLAQPAVGEQHLPGDDVRALAATGFDRGASERQRLYDVAPVEAALRALD
jgi:hypothetical protein